MRSSLVMTLGRPGGSAHPASTTVCRGDALSSSGGTHGGSGVLAPWQAVDGLPTLLRGGDEMSVRVLVVDDQDPFRLAAVAVVAAAPGFELVGSVTSGEASVEAVVALRADLVLMDVNLQGAD